MKLIIINKGGAGSGDFGHSGRPGEVGGSSGGKGMRIPKGNPIGRDGKVIYVPKGWTKTNNGIEDSLEITVQKRFGNRHKFELSVSRDEHYRLHLRELDAAGKFIRRKNWSAMTMSSILEFADKAEIDSNYGYDFFQSGGIWE